MNEKLQYAEMLDLPVSTCTITYKPRKKKKSAKTFSTEAVKERLIKKVNESVSAPNVEQNFGSCTETAQVSSAPSAVASGLSFAPNSSAVRIIKTPKKSFFKRKFSTLKVGVVGIELIAVGVLAATIFLTNAFVPQSGINTFMRSVFGAQQTVSEDIKTYKDYSATVFAASPETVKAEKGVMTISASGSVYAPCDGTLTAKTLDEKTNRYTIEITHGKDFKTVISGVDFAYSEVGGAVLKNIPVGYLSETATMCFYNGENEMITDFTLNENSVVWAV